jgi:hypothetical protein
MNEIPDDDKDTPIPFPLNKYWFSFGFGHHYGPNKIPLANCYTIVEAASYEKARDMMFEKRGPVWASDYESAGACGVDRFRLRFVPFDWLQRQQGPNL